jgi:hypothetical protein
MLGRIVHWPLAADQARAVLGSDDEELLAGLQRRDPHSIAKLYDLYGSQVCRLILDKVECRCIADDLAVETFLRAWNRAGPRKTSARYPIPMAQIFGDKLRCRLPAKRWHLEALALPIHSAQGMWTCLPPGPSLRSINERNSDSLHM